MQEALDRRNHLIHCFFRDNAMALATQAGRKGMIEELRLAEAAILAADRLTTELAMDLAKHLGITLEAIATEVERMRKQAREAEHREGQ
jgi:hypothetical protein